MTRRRLRQLHRDGITLDVEDHGPLDGEVVLLLHGFPQRASMWQGVGEHLRRRGLRTVAPDQRGYAAGARPASRWSYRVEDVVGDARALVEELGAQVHVVGHDWGAVVAWHLAAGHPDLVRSLTTVSVPHPRAYARSLTSSLQALRSWYAVAVQIPVLPEALATLAPGAVARGLRASGMTAAEAATFEREILDAGALPGALGWYRGSPWSRTSCGIVTVPTTHVWSDGDTALSRRGAELTSEYVDADYRLVVLEGVSHWIPTQEPELLAQIVLDRVG